MSDKRTARERADERWAQERKDGHTSRDDHQHDWHPFRGIFDKSDRRSR